MAEPNYFELPREVTLEEFADEMGITKTPHEITCKRPSVNSSKSSSRTSIWPCKATDWSIKTVLSNRESRRS
ncbi:helix-turn-helix domain-containing protein [Natrinema hispanicum]|uniref:helix-turn-helix domain-containing protein n=1 Tax=Natrinema hispanicum TaxID=392421 RepID=UPI001A90F1D1